MPFMTSHGDQCLSCWLLKSVGFFNSLTFRIREQIVVENIGRVSFTRALNNVFVLEGLDMTI